MMWLENSTHLPAFFNSRISSRIARVAMTSSPLVGSSSSTFCGSWISARAIAVFIFSPCEKPSVRRSARAPMSSCANSASRRALTCSRGRP